MSKLMGGGGGGMWEIIVMAVVVSADKSAWGLFQNVHTQIQVWPNLEVSVEFLADKSDSWQTCKLQILQHFCWDGWMKGGGCVAGEKESNNQGTNDTHSQ